MEAISLHNKLKYLEDLKEVRMTELKSKTVPTWVTEELLWGYNDSKDRVIAYLKAEFMEWLVKSERYEDAAWLRSELKNLEN